MSFGKTERANGHIPKFEIVIDKTGDNNPADKVKASFKDHKIIFSRGQASSKPGFFSWIKNKITAEKFKAAKEHVKTFLYPVLVRTSTSNNQRSDLSNQAYDKKGAIQADLFMNIMDTNTAGIYFIPYGKGVASVNITIVDPKSQEI